MTSPRTARRLNRILGMLPWVIAHPGATVDEVCERFGYARRELAADLDLVFVCGLPGYGPGDLMVAYIYDDEVVVEMADYFANPVRLTAPEALSLLGSGMALVSTGHAPPALERAVVKLQKVLLPDAEFALVVDLAEPELVGRLRSDAASGTVTHIRYTALGSGNTTERDIEPWSVFSTMGNWYVSAWCRSEDAERVFRVDRIREATETAHRFDPKTEPPPPVVAYTPTEEDVRADILLRPAARWVVDYYPVELLETGSSGTRIRFSASDPRVAARLLLRLGAEAELIDGEEVRSALEQLRKEILARYGNER
ncbi:MAG: helix-turn-helix transcriptional regulator [Acidimicrobiia bacterium]